MRKFEAVIPILGDAISGAFGGAVIGSLFEVALLAAIVGAIVFVVSDIKKIFKKARTSKA